MVRFAPQAVWWHTRPFQAASTTHPATNEHLERKIMWYNSHIPEQSQWGSAGRCHPGRPWHCCWWRSGADLWSSPWRWRPGYQQSTPGKRWVQGTQRTGGKKGQWIHAALRHHKNQPFILRQNKLSSPTAHRETVSLKSWGTSTWQIWQSVLHKSLSTCYVTTHKCFIPCGGRTWLFHLFIFLVKLPWVQTL